MLEKYLNVKLALLDISIYQGDIQSCRTPLFLNLISTLCQEVSSKLQIHLITLCSHWTSKCSWNRSHYLKGKEVGRDERRQALVR